MELIIWTTVRSMSCFCLLYRASPSLAAKNIINLISLLTTFMSICRVVSCVVKRMLLWPVHSLGKILLAFTLLHFILQDKLCSLLQISLDFLLLHFNPPRLKGTSFFGVLEGLVGLYRNGQLQLLLHQWLWYRLELLWCWMVCLLNQLRSFCHFWDWIQVLHFRLFCWLCGPLP